jgi:hypothetical protein
LKSQILAYKLDKVDNARAKQKTNRSAVSNIELKDNLVGLHMPKYMRVDLGRFLEIKRSGEDYEALFENGSIEISRETVEHFSYYYAIMPCRSTGLCS